MNFVVIAFFLFFISLRYLGRWGYCRVKSGGLSRQKQDLSWVQVTLQEIEETFVAGMIPSAQKWAALSQLPPPWSPLVKDSLEDLRSSGAALLPTLKRLRTLAEHQSQCLNLAQSKSAQAQAQAWICGLMVPFLGVTLYALLPSVQDHIYEWTIANLGAFLLTFCGVIWLRKLTENARWGGLNWENRSWIFSAPCAGERLLAFVRAGTPPDLAWAKTCEALAVGEKRLALKWGHSIWNSSEQNDKVSNPVEKSIIGAGVSIRRAIHLSLMEGKPCLERVETALQALNQEMEAHIDKELSLLTTRALKPLFVFVAPALFGLLGYGLWLVFVESAQESFYAF